MKDTSASLARLDGEERDVRDQRRERFARRVEAGEGDRHAETGGDLTGQVDRHPRRLIASALGQDRVAEVDGRPQHAGRGQVRDNGRIGH